MLLPVTRICTRPEQRNKSENSSIAKLSGIAGDLVIDNSGSLNNPAARLLARDFTAAFRRGLEHSFTAKLWFYVRLLCSCARL
jgi:hypothetical protein